MITIPGVEKQKIGVYGLGATGLATSAALAQSGADVFCWDEKAEARAHTDNTRYNATPPKEWPWGELASLIVSPGIPTRYPEPHLIVRKARQQKIEIIGDVELFARAVDALPGAERPRVIAVTGSNGKSTTTALIGHILKEAGHKCAVGGNIGPAILSLPPLARTMTYVVELSSFQLDLTNRFHPTTSVFLNITPDHLDRHGTLDNYVAAKERIFANQTADDLAVIGVDDDITQSVCAKMTTRAAGPKIAPVSARGSLGRGVYALSGKLFFNRDGKTHSAGDISRVRALAGAHNWQNAGAALAAVLAEGVSAPFAIGAMERFAGLPHRLETVAEWGAVRFVNDSKATNADATAKALDAFRDIFWIAGGVPKAGGVAQLTSSLKQVRGVYLIGESARAFEAQLAGIVPCFQCGDLENALARATRDARASDAPAPVVLLSPAAASYDQFRNFEDRGDRFRKLAQSLLKQNGEAA